MNINDMIYNPMFFFIAYLLVINIYGLCIMGIDKWKSSHKSRRIPEKILFIVAFIGGAAGIYSGMKVFHHKTLHNKFKYGIPPIVIADIIIVVYVLLKYK